MKLFKFQTAGHCTYGTMIIIEETEAKARELFKQQIEKSGETVDDLENQIRKIEEINLSTAQVVTYDDGDR